MREKPRDKSRLQHILKAIEKVEEFTSERVKADFTTDSLLYFGVIKNIEIIGEAAYMLSTDFKSSHPNTPWNLIIGMRHYLVHGYYNVDADEVWNTIRKDLPPLKMQIMQYLTEEEGNHV